MHSRCGKTNVLGLGAALLCVSAVLALVFGTVHRQRLRDLNNAVAMHLDFDTGSAPGSLNQDRVTALLNKGADVRVRSDLGRTVLMYAAWLGSAGLIQRALTGGVDVNARDVGGATA